MTGERAYMAGGKNLGNLAERLQIYHTFNGRHVHRRRSGNIRESRACRGVVAGMTA